MNDNFFDEFLQNNQHFQPMKELQFEKLETLKQKLNQFQQNQKGQIQKQHKVFKDISNENNKIIDHFKNNKTDFIKHPSQLTIDKLIYDSTKELPSFFIDLYKEELKKFLQKLNFKLQIEFNKEFTDRQLKERKDVIQNTNLLFDAAQTKNSASEMFQSLALIQKQLEACNKHDIKIQNFILDIFKKIKEFTQNLVKNYMQFNDECSAQRKLNFKKDELLKQELQNVQFQDPRTIVSNRYNINIQNQDLIGLSAQIEITPRIQQYFHAYLNERNFDDENNEFYIYPYGFVNRISPHFDVKQIDFKSVRNDTKEFFGSEFIYKKYDNVLMNVVLNNDQQIIVLITNKPYQQIHIIENEQNHNIHQELRTRIFNIVKGYIYYEMMDKSGESSDDCLKFCDDYIKLDVMIQPFQLYDFRINYINFIKQLADGNIDFDYQALNSKDIFDILVDRQQQQKLKA